MTTVHPVCSAARLLVHCFARGKVEWKQVEGGKWRSTGGRVLSDASYQKVRAKADAAKKGPARTSAQTAKALEADRAGRNPPETKGPVAEYLGAPAAGKPKAEPFRVDGQAPSMYDLPVGIEPTGVAGGSAYRPQSRSHYRPPAPLPPPPKAPALPNDLPAPPPPTPKQNEYIQATHARDTKRFGAKAAEFLRGALAYGVGMLTAGNGAAWGALAGLAVGGPLGLALGTSLGGGLGARLGGNLAKKTYSVLGGAGRAAVTARQAARAVVPKAVAAPIGAAALAGSIGTNIAMQSAGATVGGPIGQGVGAALGIPAGIVAGNAGLDMAQAAAKGTRSLMARSKAAKRVAARDNRNKIFAETPPAPEKAAPEKAAPPDLDPVQLVKARLKAAFAREGKPVPEITDEVVMSALAMAGMAADQQAQTATTAAMGERCRVLKMASKKIRRARTRR